MKRRQSFKTSNKVLQAKWATDIPSTLVLNYGSVHTRKLANEEVLNCGGHDYKVQRWVKRLGKLRFKS